MNDETSVPPSKRTGSVLLDNPQLYNLLMSAIDDRVSARVREKNEVLRKWLIGVLTIVVTLIAAGGALTLRSFVDDAVEEGLGSAVQTAVNETVEPAVEEALSAVKFDTAVVDLNFRAMKLDDAESFTAKEAEFLIRKIEELVLESQDDESLGKLAFAVETVSNNFAQANRLDFVVRIEEIVPSMFLDNEAIVPTMVALTAYRLLGDAGAPNSWKDPDGLRRETYESYRKYSKGAEAAGYPELTLLFELLLGFVEGRSVDTIENLIRDIDSLNAVDTDNFQFVMLMFATGAYETGMTESTVESSRVASHVTEFLCQHGRQREVLQRVSEAANLEC